MDRTKMILKGNYFGNSPVRISGAIDLDADSNTFAGPRGRFEIGPGVDARLTGNRSHSGETGPTRLTTGWTRPQGAALPVYCSSCHTIFPSRTYVFGGRFFESWDNVETCVACGSPDAKLSEGLFKFSRDVVEILSAPDITFVMMQAIARTSADFAAGRITKSAAIGKLSKLSPAFASLLGKAAKIGGGAVVFLAAAAAIWSAAMDHENLEISKRQLELAEQEAALDKAGETSSDWKMTQLLQAMWQLAGSIDEMVQKGEEAARTAPPSDKPQPSTIEEDDGAKQTPE